MVSCKEPGKHIYIPQRALGPYGAGFDLIFAQKHPALQPALVAQVITSTLMCSFAAFKSGETELKAFSDFVLSAFFSATIPRRVLRSL